MPETSEKNYILIKGARANNLKNIDLQIPRDKFIVMTGLSGSGKSSLAFDTIYAEGQRRYVESLSAYARQFLGRINKPEVDYIKGLPPAIAIEQRVASQNPRSTVGTTSEVYDYIKLLFARIGRTYSPVTGIEVKRHRVTDVVNYLLEYPEGTRLLILSPFLNHKDNLLDYLEFLMKEGFTRLYTEDGLIRIDELLSTGKIEIKSDDTFILIDRIVIQRDDDSKGRFADSIQTAFQIGGGTCLVKEADTISHEYIRFSNNFEADGIEFEEPNVHMFSFNNPVGACPRCEGYGSVIGIDENLVVPDKSLSVYEDAVVCWKGEKMSKWKQKLLYAANSFDFPVHKPYSELTNEQKDILWKGNRYFKGINAFFNYVESKKYKIQYRVMLSRYRGKTICPDCNGGRLKKEASYVKAGGYSIGELAVMPITELSGFFNQLQLTSHEAEVAKRLLTEIRSRLDYLLNVGLGYLTLNRLSSSLSGGESQRINLATSLGSNLVGSLYILDEPSIGLHPRDTHRLIKVLRNLQNFGNTVIVVEHDEEVIREADIIIDIGPLAGSHGGEIVFFGTNEELHEDKNSITGDYLKGVKSIEVPLNRRKWNNYLFVRGARENNLKGFDVKFPLNILTVVTGVSGSGKSSLVCDILYPALRKRINGYADNIGIFDGFEGDIHLLKNVEMIDQNPIGKSSRSNPVTYVKAFDEIRKLFANQPAAEHFDFKPSHFSFNVEGGRCEECQGEGIIRVEMQFMADVRLICESCNGQRYKEDVLEVTYKGKNIFDVLNLTVDDAIDFFGNAKGTLEKKIVEKLTPLASVGLGYVKLGQSSSTLSGGESQRIKLASFLGKEGSHEHNIFIFDEPTTGLHFHDISKLLDAFNALIERGHTIIVIEHNMEVIKSADWVIDLGPEGGNEGGNLLFEGVPEKLAELDVSYTGRFLKAKFESTLQH